MKRAWIGAALLTALLALSLWASRTMTAIHEPIARDLDRAAACSLREDWDGAAMGFSQALAQWQKWDRLRCCLADHNSVEQTDARMAAAEVWLLAKEPAAFASACRSLAKQVDALGQSHSILWWNLL